MRYGEDLMDALELSDTFREELEQFAIELEIHQKKPKSAKPVKPTPNIRFLGRNIFDHVLLHFNRIRSSELENTL